MAENIIVGVIVSVVLLLAGRSFYRTLFGETGGCTCCRSGCHETDPRNQARGVKRDQEKKARIQ